MKIKIHRGINQIGGCITEIATEKTRILIDLGQNLPDGDGVVIDTLAHNEAIGELTTGIDAILYTHYHGDHFGLFKFVPDNIPQYIGAVAKEVVLCKHNRLLFIEGCADKYSKEIAKIESMHTFVAEQVVEIGDIRLTPYFVSHSAYDSYMFLIEAGGKRILHTGDFRDHGYLGKGLIPMLKSLVLKQGDIDFLITEGTMLSRIEGEILHEKELRTKMREAMEQYKSVFVLCSSTDLERLATIYSANRSLESRPFVCDDFQAMILKIFQESAGERSGLFKFKKCYTFFEKNTKLLNWMQDKGFCMLVRPTDKFADFTDRLLPMTDPANTLLIYSTWSEYINPLSKHANRHYINFISRFPNIVQTHTSGHASPKCLAQVCNLVNPKLGIIPIHSEDSTQFANLPLKKELKQKILTQTKKFASDFVEIIQR